MVRKRGNELMALGQSFEFMNTIPILEYGRPQVFVFMIRGDGVIPIHEYGQLHPIQITLG